MRPDVKLGVVISMVVVLVAGGYFIFRGHGEAPVPVANGSGSLSGQASGPSAAKTPDRTRGRADQRSNATAAQPGGTTRTAASPATRSDGRVVPGSRQTRGPETTTGRPTPGSLAQREGRTAGPAGGAAERPTTAPTVAPPETAGGAAAAAVEGSRTADAESSGRPGETERDRERAPETTGTAEASPGAPGASTVADASGRPTSGSAAPIPLTAAPGPTVAPTAAPTRGGPPAVDTHRVQEGDTLSSLARRYYGSEQHARFLAESNPQLPDPGRLAVGALVKIPPLPSPSGDTALSPSTASASPGAPARTYRVQSGDSFYTIARETLHDAARWKELFELNKDLVKGDPRKLQVGQVITLPPR